MIVNITQPDLKILPYNVTLNADSITFKQSVISVTISVSVLNGNIVLNITDATAVGLGLFGTIRKKAGDIILSSLLSYRSILTAFKDSKGNIEISIKGVNCVAASIVGGELSVNVGFS